MNVNLIRVLVALLAVFLVLPIANAAYHLIDNSYKTETAVLSTVADKSSFNAVYVRDEQVINYDNNGAVRYSVSDGGKVGKNSEIAKIYNTEEDIEIWQKLEQKRNQLEILRKIQNPGTAEVAQPTFLSSLISERYRNIAYNKEFKNISEIQDDKNQLLVLLSTMQMITGEDTTFNQRIAELESEISQLEKQAQEPKDVIYSSKSAYFVSKVDGYESTLTPSVIDSLTPEQIKAVSNNSGNTDGTIGKFVMGYEWNMVGVIDNSQKMFAEGDEITLNFESSGISLPATVGEVRDTENPQETVITLSCSKLTEDFVANRVEKVEAVKQTYEGIKIPRSAIRFQDEDIETEVTNEAGNNVLDSEGKKVVTKESVRQRGVFVKLGERVVFRKIDVIYEGDNFVISKIRSDTDYLQLYDDVITEGVE